MRTKSAMILSTVLVFASTLYALWLYPHLPPKVPSHWDLNGKVDGWSDKTFALWFAPLLMTGTTLVLMLLPRISPKQFKVDSFRGTFNYVMVLIVSWMAVMNVLTLQAGMHPGIDVGRWIVASVLVLIALLGNQLGRIHRNFWMGIRTPWTLASERVWIATHRLSAWLFVAVGVLGAGAVIVGFPPLAAFVILMAAVVIPVLYSLMLYKQLEARQAL